MTSRIFRLFAAIGFGAVTVIGYVAALAAVVYTSWPSSIWAVIMRLPIAAQFWVYDNWIVPSIVKDTLMYEYYFTQISNLGAVFSLGSLWIFISIFAYIGSAVHDSRLSRRLL